MSVEIKVPVLPESVKDATIAAWHKKTGDAVTRDEPLVDIETDKVVLEVVAPTDGVLREIVKEKGAMVVSAERIGSIEAGVVREPAAVLEPELKVEQKAVVPEEPAPVVAAGPAARRAAFEAQSDLSSIKGTGKHGRILSSDVQMHQTAQKGSMRLERREPMTRLRARIAERLVASQREAAILTTFNEINMKAVLDLRQRYKEDFEKQHGIRLGLMSFFCLAAVAALKRHPMLNASIEGQDIIHHDYYDLGVAVSSPRGLVVPVLRDVDALSIEEIEKKIAQFGAKAKAGTLSIEELQGGTFTLSNGGVFGSLMSTPIINPPQSGILGLHKIEERPVVEAGQIVIRPMMYVALSYDHRIIDGADSVRFLVAIKEMIEDPSRLLLQL